LKNDGFTREKAKVVFETFKNKTTHVQGLFSNEDLETLHYFAQPHFDDEEFGTYYKKLYYQAVMESEYLSRLFKLKFYLKFKCFIRFRAFLKIIHKAFKMLLQHTINDPNDNNVIKEKLKVRLNDFTEATMYNRWPNPPSDINRRDGQTFRWVR
jgi:hypothetical protein